MNWTEYELISKEELFKRLEYFQQQLDKALEELDEKESEGNYSEGYDDGYSEGYCMGKGDEKDSQSSPPMGTESL